ncbi:MAG: hypothetical protein IPK80_19785 [Nannocystis sp.]|nr:hypothetical protein [Nannocystis sp.]
MRRTLDLLVPSGIGVFLIPAGFMSGRSSRGLREKILLRHHLLGAYRLPSHDTNGREIVPGAFVVMDIVIWRSRGGELREVDADDIYILDGEYFEQHPDQILGDEEGSFAGEDEAGNKKDLVALQGRGRFSRPTPAPTPPDLHLLRAHLDRASCRGGHLPNRRRRRLAPQRPRSRATRRPRARSPRRSLPRRPRRRR